MTVVDVAIDALGLGTQVELAECMGRKKQDVSQWHKEDRISSPGTLEILRLLLESKLPDGRRRKIPLILFYADLYPDQRPEWVEGIEL